MPRSKNMNQTPTSLNNNKQIIPGTVPDLSKTLSQIVELQPHFRGQKYLALEEDTHDQYKGGFLNFPPAAASCASWLRRPAPERAPFLRPIVTPFQLQNLSHSRYCNSK